MLYKTPWTHTELITQSYVKPIQNFFSRYGFAFALMLLSLIGFYRISDIVLGAISNIFYQDLGFSKEEIASVVKTFGLIMTLVGGFLGGFLTTKFGVYRILWWGALLACSTNLLFMLLAYQGEQLYLFYLVISADSLAAGLSSAAFVAFMSSLTHSNHTAVQYAIFSSLMTLLPKVLGGYSGTIVDNIGYPKFFLCTTLMGVPILVLVHICKKRAEQQETLGALIDSEH